MPVFYLGLDQHADAPPLPIRWELGEGLVFGAMGPAGERCTSTTADGLRFFSTPPVVNTDGAYRTLPPEAVPGPLETVLDTIQNEVVALEFRKSGDDFGLVIASARFSRGRFYFLVLSDALLFAPDLLDLLPWSGRRASPKCLYAILKYGDTPEYETCVQDIFAVPAASFLELDRAGFDGIIRAGRIELGGFQQYFRLTYPMTGGDPVRTEEILSAIAGHAARERPQVLISGGVDSTLLNALLARHLDEPWPAHFLAFGTDEPELPFAKEAVRGSRAELHVWTMQARDFVPSLHTAAKRLQQPINDNGATLVGAFFDGCLGRAGTTGALLDGTAADSCYGVRDYRTPLAHGPRRSRAMTWFAERAVAFLRSHRLPMADRLSPRDAIAFDPCLDSVQWYIGPFANTWFPEAGPFTTELRPAYYWYLNLLGEGVAERDEWARYTIFKAWLYAARQTTAKTLEILRSATPVYPFMYLDVLLDSQRYSWAEKATGGVVKWPLKHILEGHREKSFVHRRKVGLNSRVLLWSQEPENAGRLRELLATGGGIAERLLHRKAHARLARDLGRVPLHPDLQRLGLGLALEEAWLEAHDVTVV